MAKLYLKNNIPWGQRVYLMDPANQFKKLRPGYLLFPHKCDVNIPEDVAERLLEQDGHILSTEPTKFKEAPAATVTSPDHKTRQLAKEEVPDEEQPIDTAIFRVLSEIAAYSEAGFLNITPKQINDYSAILNVKNAPTQKKHVRLRILAERARELANRLEDDELLPPYDFAEPQEVPSAEEEPEPVDA